MSTIDPGVEDAMQEAAQHVESHPKIQEEMGDKTAQEKSEEDEDLMNPTEWWFASTLCPLLAATFGPLANGFSICALVYPWRSYIPPGETPAFGVRMNDPKWLIAINAVSLAFALIGNLTLLLNMAKRLKFSIAQPITITGFFVAGVLLIADMAALSSSSTYFITDPKAIPSANHALTSAFYYAVWAAAIYMIVGFLMCITVYGANKGYYKRDFALSPSQRTLMLQTMSFVVYLLVGAEIFSVVEGWKYLDAVYWAQVTLLTIGFGDYTPQTRVGRGLLFPYAIGGILTVGLVVGSTRTLVLERGKQKLSARIIEKRREHAIHNVDARRQTIKISWLSQAEFSVDPRLTPAQRREEEFKVMRKVQKTADRERRYMALGGSLFFALLLWFVGAAIFMVCERESQWTFFQSLYFTFVALMTIGYGDYSPASNSGKAFFVLWSTLAVPSLTILISNMGDTIVKWVSDITTWLASFTVLPEKKGGVKQTTSNVLGRLTDRAADVVSRFTAPGLLGATKHDSPADGQQHYNNMLERLAQRLEVHIEHEELEAALKAEDEGDFLQRDMHFYLYVLSREMRDLQKDVHASPPKEYPWHEWEYYLKLMGNMQDEEEERFPGQKVPSVLVPNSMRIARNLIEIPDETSSPKPDIATSASNSSTALADKDGVVDRQTEKKNKYAWHGPKQLRRHPTDDPLGDWSWLSEESPLMSSKSEAEWIIERLSAALVRELNRQRKGYIRQPPISMRHIIRANETLEKHEDAKARGSEDEEKEAMSEERKAAGKGVVGES